MGLKPLKDNREVGGGTKIIGIPVFTIRGSTKKEAELSPRLSPRREALSLRKGDVGTIIGGIKG